jgi:hypothetical protein
VKISYRNTDQKMTELLEATLGEPNHPWKDAKQ